ncbi:DoxX-like family protein [Chitinophaga sp. 30R24]|uniref:DoxX-like family protein n=1 Tax=Chitinophaga sp. 30R24 TaxID=3248838 RepID=UPI003B8F9D2C
MMIALVWFVNGFICKVMNKVPRHQQIVSRILGEVHATLLTRIIGWLEIGMAVWILSGIKPSWCALLQILLIGVMNVIEFILAADLLLFGRVNIIFAVIFMAVIYINECKPLIDVIRF